ncbi:unnamed protein product, partial [marine sediment metagenome]
MMKYLEYGSFTNIIATKVFFYLAKKSDTKNRSDSISTPNELKSNNFNANEQEDENDVKMTPDFIPMIRIIFWNSMGFFFFSFLIPHVINQLALPTILGLAFSIQMIGGLLSAPIVGYLTDRVSKKLLILLGSFGRATCYILMYIGILLSSLLVFTVGMFILGFFVGFFWTPLDTLISEKSNKDNRSFAFGKRGGMIGKGNLVGSVISITIFSLANIFVPENLFLVYCPLLLFALSNILGGFIFHFKVDETLTFEKHIFNVFPSSVEPSIVSKEPVISETPLKSSSNLSIGFFIGFSVLVIAFMTTNFNQSLVFPYSQGYLKDVLEIKDSTLVMIIYFPSQIISLLLAPKLGKIADKINPVLGMAIVSGLGAFVTWLIINSTSGYMFGIL